MFYGVLFIIHLRKVRKKLKFITGSFIQLLPIKISLKDGMINKGTVIVIIFQYDTINMPFGFEESETLFPIYELVNYVCARTRKYGRLHI